MRMVSTRHPPRLHLAGISMVFQYFSLLDGSFVIWEGPITDNTGKVQLAKDTVADDQFLGGLNFYVKGVEAKCRATRKRLHRVRPAACGRFSVFLAIT